MKKLHIIAFAGLFFFSAQAQSKWALGLTGHIGGQVYVQIPFINDFAESPRYTTAYNLDAVLRPDNRFSLILGLSSLQKRINTFSNHLSRQDYVGPMIGLQYNFLNTGKQRFYAVARYSYLMPSSFSYITEDTREFRFFLQTKPRVAENTGQLGLGILRKLSAGESTKGFYVKAEVNSFYTLMNWKINDSYWQQMHLTAGVGLSYQF